MKKGIIYVCAAMMLAACNDGKKQELENAQALAAATHEELVQAIQERDQLLDILNEITATTEQIKEAEKIVSINMSGTEGEASKSEVLNNIEAMKTTLEGRRKQLEDLEASLKNSKNSNAKLLATIESLKSQIADQDAEITALNARLSAANTTIVRLNQSVDSLSNRVADIGQQRDAAMQEAEKQEALANACYYAIGSSKELKDHNIVEGGGFLRKSKIMTGDFDLSFFTQADKRTLNQIVIHGKKASIVTKFQPKDSYQIVKDGDNLVLKILDPKAFWSVSNYLVIKID